MELIASSESAMEAEKGLKTGVDGIDGIKNAVLLATSATVAVDNFLDLGVLQGSQFSVVLELTVCKRWE